MSQHTATSPKHPRKEPNIEESPPASPTDQNTRDAHETHQKHENATNVDSQWRPASPFTPIAPKDCPFESLDTVLVPSPPQEDKVTIFLNEAETETRVRAASVASSTQIALVQQTKALPSSLLRNYMQLWKTRLSLLVVFTAMGSYYCTRVNEKDVIIPALKAWIFGEKQTEGPATDASKVAVGSILALCVGTFLQAGMANSLNEMMEVDRDRIMNRTMRRPLPTGSISMAHAGIQAVAVGALGTWILGNYCDWNTSAMGALNIGIYAGIYTPLKTRHWTNTWVGTLNGAIPPLMGSCAASGGKIFTPTGLFWFALMSLWQIPHFMAISYKCRTEYNKAGYKMLPIEQPRLASNMAVWHSLALFPLCWALPALIPHVPWWFAAVTTPINWRYALQPSLQFRRDMYRDVSTFESKKAMEKTHYDNATLLFWRSLKHLPMLFTLSMVALNWDTVTSTTSSWWDTVVSFFTKSSGSSGGRPALQFQ